VLARPGWPRSKEADSLSQEHVALQTWECVPDTFWISAAPSLGLRGGILVGNNGARTWRRTWYVSCESSDAYQVRPGIGFALGNCPGRSGIRSGRFGRSLAAPRRPSLEPALGFCNSFRERTSSGGRVQRRSRCSGVCVNNRENVYRTVASRMSSSSFGRSCAPSALQSNATPTPASGK
jgi:hypothetical protein